MFFVYLTHNFDQSFEDLQIGNCHTWYHSVLSEVVKFSSYVENHRVWSEENWKYRSENHHQLQSICDIYTLQLKALEWCNCPDELSTYLNCWKPENDVLTIKFGIFRPQIRNVSTKHLVFENNKFSDFLFQIFY